MEITHHAHTYGIVTTLNYTCLLTSAQTSLTEDGHTISKGQSSR